MPNFFHPLNVTPWSPNSLATKILASGFDSISDASDGAYPAANLAIYVPFYLQAPMLVKTVYWANGAAVSGNIDVGVYDAGKRKIYSTGSIAQAGVNSIQKVTPTPFTLGTGLFFLAISMDNTTGVLLRITMTSLAFYQTLGVYQQSVFPLPATATFSLPTSDYLPLFGIAPRSVQP
jgi:hypothetical protein